ncbi:MAG: hypothetical protein AAGA85_04590 [Bacteroidota bacterium]
MALFLVIGALAFLICCNSEDDRDPSSSIEGVVWTQIQSEFANCTNPDDAGINMIECDQDNCTTVLYQDGVAFLTEVIDGITTTTEFPYTLSGSTLSSSGLSATIRVEENTLTVTNENVFGCQLIETWTSSN